MPGRARRSAANRLRGARVLAGEADRIEVQRLGRLDRPGVDLVRGEQHVGAGVAVEHELALAVRAQRDEGQGGARLGGEPQRADIDTGRRRSVSARKWPNGSSPTMPQKALATPSRARPTATLAAAPPGAFWKAGASTRPVPVAVGTKSINRSPTQTT